MKQFSFLLILIGSALFAQSQYRGGSDDGTSHASVANQNPLPNIYTGGNDDGASHGSVANQNPLPNIYTGGNDDGASHGSVANQNPLPNIYTGRNDDGTSYASSANQNPLPNIYTGGNDDGTSHASIANQNPLPNIYTGGNDDGTSHTSVGNQNPLPNIYAGGNDDGTSYASIANQNPLPNIYAGGNDDGTSHASIANQNPLPDIYTGGNDDGFGHSSVTNQNPAPFSMTCPANITISCLNQLPACPSDIAGFLALPGASIIGFCSEDLNISCNTSTVSGSNCNGTFNRTYTISDNCGNSASCTQVITVIDNTKPIASNPLPINVQCKTAIPVANRNVVTDAIDNCSNPTVALQSETNNGGSGCPGSPYIITRTYRVTDACGNYVDVVQTLTALDNTKPTASNPAPVNVQCIGSIPASNINVVADAADNCSIPTVALQMETNNGGAGCPGNPFIVTRIYRVTDACGNYTDVVQYLSAVDNTKPVISGCKSSASRTLPFNQSSYSIQGNEFDVSATDNCSSATLTYSLNGASNGSGTTLDHVGLLPGVTTITWTAIDGCGNTQICIFNITVNKRTTVIVYTGDHDEQYSDQQSLSAELRDQQTNTLLSNKSINFSVGSQNVSAITNASGFASAFLRMFQNAGNYNVSASFAGDAIYAGSSVTETFQARKENASVEYTGPEFVSVPCTTCSSTTILLSALITDTSSGSPAGDPFPGDIRKARVKFVDLNTAASLSGWLTPGLLNPSDTTRGVVTYSWTVPLPSIDYDTYSVGVISESDNLGAGNYTGYAQTVINVSKNSLTEFITGGGQTLPTSSGGSYSSDPGKRLNFGFNVKWNKSNKNLQGKVNIIFRKGAEVYQVKSTSITSLTSNSSNPCSKKSTFISKANLQIVTNPDIAPVSVLGNLTLQMDIVDNGEPGINNDRIGISLFNGNTLIYSTSLPYTTTLALSGGNIVVHDGTVCNNASVTTKMNQSEELPVKVDVLTVKAFPNPSEGNFNLQVLSKNNEPVEITVYGITGKMMKKVNGFAGQVIRFGGEWLAGIYVAEIRQGGERKTIKLIKQ